ncbi:MAG: VOC family protein [Myxococcota bacterium]
MNSEPRELYLNLIVRDLDRTMAFFRRLGFSFESAFSNEQVACMRVSDRAFVMFLVPEFFATFTSRAPADPHATTASLYAFSASGRAEVDAMVTEACAAGGEEARPPTDQGPMYSRSFYDLDGHQWEVLWMDMSAMTGAATDG